MATQSQALSSDPAAAGKIEPPTPSELSRCVERRIPSARESMATLPELEAADAFEPHDTIPAPPWLEDESAPVHEAP
jgi:hypothetical protein